MYTAETAKAEASQLLKEWKDSSQRLDAIATELEADICTTFQEGWPQNYLRFLRQLRDDVKKMEEWFDDHSKNDDRPRSIVRQLLRGKSN